MVRRWQQLPLDHALNHVGAVRTIVDELAAAQAPGETVPDLGPAVLMDQLTVLVYDACGAGAAAEHRLEQRLADLRRSLT